MCVDILRRCCPNTQKFVGAHASGLAVCTYYTMWCKLELCLLLIIFQLSESKELGRDMSLKLVDDFEEKCRKKINTSFLEFGPKEFDEGRIRLCYSCALTMSCGVVLNLHMQISRHFSSMLNRSSRESSILHVDFLMPKTLCIGKKQP